MSGRFAEMILSVCMLLAVELGGFDVEIGTGGYTETPPGCTASARYRSRQRSW